MVSLQTVHYSCASSMTDFIRLADMKLARRLVGVASFEDIHIVMKPILKF